MLGGLGPGTEILSPFQCDYGYQIEVGARTFINFGAVILDSAPVRIGDDVQIGPGVQLATPPHPLDPTSAARTSSPPPRSPLPTTYGWPPGSSSGPA
jgi:acetyltransferase-like isoleucine patch superfamily enzyme